MKNLSLNFFGSVTAVVFLFGGLAYADTTQTSAPTDSQIVKIVETANNAEIDASKLATKSSNKDVKKLARNMVKAHSNSNGEVEKLARSLSLKVDDSQASDDLKKDTDAKLTELKTLKGAAFDKAYVDNLVAAHENVLKTLDDTLIPSAKDARLKSLLTETRAVVETHLDHAKRVQTALNK